MADNLPAEARESLERFLKPFVNLLKEFPKDAVDDFIYDDSTLKKIGAASEELDRTSEVLKRGADHFDEAGDLVREAIGIFSGLFEELPRDSADEFLYDRDIHNQVEAAREAVVNLYQMLA
jgi:hypothetical protein